MWLRRFRRLWSFDARPEKSQISPFKSRKNRNRFGLRSGDPAFKFHESPPIASSRFPQAKIFFRRKTICSTTSLSAIRNASTTRRRIASPLGHSAAHWPLALTRDAGKEYRSSNQVYPDRLTPRTIV